MKSLITTTLNWNSFCRPIPNTIELLAKVFSPQGGLSGVWSHSFMVKQTAKQNKNLSSGKNLPDNLWLECGGLQSCFPDTNFGLQPCPLFTFWTWIPLGREPIGCGYPIIIHLKDIVNAHLQRVNLQDKKCMAERSWKNHYIVLNNYYKVCMKIKLHTNQLNLL